MPAIFKSSLKVRWDRLARMLGRFCHERSRQAAPVIAALQQRATPGDLTLSLSERAPSLLYMQVNRLLRSAQRAQELVLYDFLDRLYTSQLARIQGG